MDRKILAFLILFLIVVSIAPLTPKVYAGSDRVLKFLGGTSRNPYDVIKKDLPWDNYKDAKFVKGQSRPKTGYGETPFTTDEGITVTIYPNFKLNGKWVWKFFWVLWNAVPTNKNTPGKWLKYSWRFGQYPKEVEWWVEKDGSVVKPKSSVRIGSTNSNHGVTKLYDDEFERYGLITTEDIPASLKFSSKSSGDYVVKWKNIFSVGGTSIIKVKALEANENGVVTLYVEDETVLEIEKGQGSGQPLGGKPKGELTVETNIDDLINFEIFYDVPKFRVRKDGGGIRDKLLSLLRRRLGLTWRLKRL